MLLSLRTTLRSLSLLIATVAFAPGCDGEEYEALGLTVEDIDAMSEDELDQLAAIDELSAPLPADEPSHQRPDAVDALGNPIHFTHVDADSLGEIRNPIHFTHADADSLGEIRNPIHFTHAHKRPGAVPTITNPIRRTHNSDGVANNAVGELVSEVDDGCDTHGDDPDYTNR
ncbi:hypothetical protein [Nannocystis sp.]|uniref:hypothetical protein n=1 Tax=Nannocystis sp. TaxID=1962667 RepID=UPI0025E5F163|nr:hypothetical protein [Nannocystis sp.]MBK7824920.1 hypothetical protein [Nannocystis sp.]